MHIALKRQRTTLFKDPLVRKFILRFAFFWLIWWISEWFFPGWLIYIDDAITQFVTVSAALIQNAIHGTNITVGGPHSKEPWCLIDNDISVVRIGNACNGRNLVVLYVSFLLALPLGGFENKVLFALIGIFFILLMNILRIYGLFQVALTAPYFFQFLHKYLFQTFIYIDMYLLWRGYLHFETKRRRKKVHD